jgi:hypothetical protein
MTETGDRRSPYRITLDDVDRHRIKIGQTHAGWALCP